MPLDPIVKELNKKCLEMVKGMQLDKITATLKPMEETGVAAVKIDIPYNESKTGLVTSIFLGAILDADPKLLTIYNGMNGGHVSYRLQPEGKYNKATLLADIKKEVVEAINKYKNASPSEQEKILENAVKHYDWFEKNNGFDTKSGLDKLKEDLQRFGNEPVGTRKKNTRTH